MRRVMSLAALMLLLFVCSGSSQCVTNAAASDDGVFVTKAQELTAGKSSRIDKLQSLYAFVQTEIAQAKTQYG